jgi:hypothetical protein
MLTKEGFIEHYPDRCFGAGASENLERQWENGRIGYDFPNLEEYEAWCFARSTAELVTGDVRHRYYSTGTNIFFEVLGTGDRFWIINGWRFFWNFGNFAGGYYMLEGRCDLID